MHQTTVVPPRRLHHAFGALALLLAGCHESTPRVDWQDLVLEDPLANGAPMHEAQHARTPAHWNVAGVRRAPLLTRGFAIEQGESVLAPASRPLIPAQSLLWIEVRLLPAVDCGSAPDWLMGSADFSRLQPVDSALLAGLGEPESSHRGFVVPSYVLGAAAGAPSGSAVDFGPPWLGLPLRLAGPGGELLFPPSIDCAPSRPGRADTLPLRGFSQWANPGDALSIPQDRPFLVSVVEVCPVRLRQQEEHYTVPGRWLWSPPSERWRYTGEIQADCASGAVLHRSLPNEIRSALGARRLSDAYRTDIARAPPPVW